jgi:hypothetical protein
MRVIIGIATLCIMAACGRTPKAAAPPQSNAPVPTQRRGEVAPPLTVNSRPCGTNPMRILGDRVGAVRLDMPVDSVRMWCRVVADTFEYSEGERYRTLRIAIGRDTVRSWITDRGTVSNVEVTSPRFMTTDSIRVGTPLARLLAFRDLRWGYGEGDFFVMSDAPGVCGLSFAIDFGANRPQLRGDPTREQLEQLASTAKVRWILVRRCDPR